MLAASDLRPFKFQMGDSKEADYTCPKCCVWEIERGLRMPLPQNSVLGAKDLSRAMLSEHIEEQLFKRLRKGRHERAIYDRKSYDEILASCMCTFFGIRSFSGLISRVIVMLKAENEARIHIYPSTPLPLRRSILFTQDGGNL